MTRLMFSAYQPGIADERPVEICHPKHGVLGVIHPTEDGIKIVSERFNPHVDAIARDSELEVKFQ
jgi:hypothetical protein